MNLQVNDEEFEKDQEENFEAYQLTKYSNDKRSLYSKESESEHSQSKIKRMLLGSQSEYEEKKNPLQPFEPIIEDLSGELSKSKSELLQGDSQKKSGGLRSSINDEEK